MKKAFLGVSLILLVLSVFLGCQGNTTKNSTEIPAEKIKVDTINVVKMMRNFEKTEQIIEKLADCIEENDSFRFGDMEKCCDHQRKFPDEFSCFDCCELVTTCDNSSHSQLCEQINVILDEGCGTAGDCGDIVSMLRNRLIYPIDFNIRTPNFYLEGLDEFRKKGYQFEVVQVMPLNGNNVSFRKSDFAKGKVRLRVIPDIKSRLKR